MGVSSTTVRRWCDSDFAERSREHSRDWKANNKKRLRKYDRARYKEERDPCPSCGRKMRSGARRCARCRDAEAKKRRQRIASLWLAGETASEIAEQVGTTRGAIYAQLALMREAGQDLPHRYPKARRRQLAEASKKAVAARKGK